MSVHLTSTVWKLPKIDGLNFADKAILLKLADHADSDGGSCFPSRARIAEECWCSEKTVTRAIDRLIKFGFVTKKFRKNTTNIYQIKVQKLEALVAQKTLKSRGDRESFTGGTESPPVGDRESFTGGTESPPNHQYNHQFNRQSSSASGRQQQPISESDFYALRDEVCAEQGKRLPNVIPKDGTLFAKFQRYGERYGLGSISARKFLELEQPPIETAKQRKARKAAEDHAVIEKCHKLTGYGADSRADAERIMAEYEAGERPHWKDSPEGIEARRQRELVAVDDMPDF